MTIDGLNMKLTIETETSPWAEDEVVHATVDPCPEEVVWVLEVEVWEVVAVVVDVEDCVVAVVAVVVGPVVTMEVVELDDITIEVEVVAMLEE